MVMSRVRVRVRVRISVRNMSGFRVRVCGDA